MSDKVVVLPQVFTEGLNETQDDAPIKIKMIDNGDGTYSVSTAEDGVASALASRFIIKVKEDSGDPNITYVGMAPTGSVDTASVWQLRRIDENDGTIVTYKGSGLFNQRWDQRETGSYA